MVIREIQRETNPGEEWVENERKAYCTQIVTALRLQNKKRERMAVPVKRGHSHSL